MQRETAEESPPGADPPVKTAGKEEILRFVFVGDRPSLRAARIGATLQNGKLAGKTLREALLALYLDPDEQEYRNLYPCPNATAEDRAREEEACQEIERLMEQGFAVVGLGHKVSRRLTAHAIPHLKMIHPAARGSIRRRECYCLHVETILSRARKEKR